MVFADGNKTEFYIACQFLSNLVQYSDNKMAMAEALT